MSEQLPGHGPGCKCQEWDNPPPQCLASPAQPGTWIAEHDKHYGPAQPGTDAALAVAVRRFFDNAYRVTLPPAQPGTDAALRLTGPDATLTQVLRDIFGDLVRFNDRTGRAEWWESIAASNADRIRAALTSPPAEPTLDVDRFEHAYVKVLDRTPWAEVTFSAMGGLEVQRRMFLERIAAEYLRLATIPEGAPEP